MKLYIWDFHGVLEKGNEYAVLDTCNQLLEYNNVNRVLSLQEALSFQGLGPHHIYSRIFPGKNDKSFPAFIALFEKLGLEAAGRHVKPMDYSGEVLGKIKDRGDKNIVISYCPQYILEHFLNLTNHLGHLESYFGVAYCKGSPLDAKYKVAKEYINGKKYTSIMAIGDSEHDIETGLKLGATTILFSKDESRINNTKAHHVISDLRKILDL